MAAPAGEVVAVDLVCRACWATCRDLPWAMARVFAAAHRDAVVVQAYTEDDDGERVTWRKT